MTKICGVSGEIGSFSEQAILFYMKKQGISAELHYLIDMEGVLQAIEERKIDFGIFPVVNLQGGLVKPAFIAMGSHSFKIVDEFWLDIQHCLLALPGTGIKKIDQIVSHQQGFAQCKTYLRKHFEKVERVGSCNTAIAAKELSEGLFTKNTAVIASERAAQIYGLDVLAKNIQDTQPNYTIFIIVKNPADTDIKINKEWQHA